MRVPTETTAAKRDVVAYGPAPQRRRQAAPSFNINLLLNALRRHVWLFIGVAAAIFIVGLLAVMSQTPLYSASASIVIDRRSENISGVDQVLSDLPTDAAMVDTEVEVLRSRELAQRVVEALNLQQDPDINPAMAKPAALASLKRAILSPLSKSAPAQTAAPINPEDMTVDAVMQNLAVRRVGLTYVMQVTFTAKTPQKAAKIANAVADLYILRQIEVKSGATEQAVEALNERVAAQSSEFVAQNAQVQQYRVANDILGQDNGGIAEAELSAYNQRLAEARAKLAGATARLEAAKSQLQRGSGDDLGAALNSIVIQNLRQQRISAAADVAAKSERFGDLHPDLVEARNRLASIDGDIRTEIARIVSSQEAEAAAAQGEVDRINADMMRAKGRLQGNTRAQAGLNELETTADTTRSVLEGLQTRLQEASSLTGLATAEARVVSRATPPGGPQSPNILVGLAVSLIAAMGLGMGSVLLAELLNPSLANDADVEDQLGVAFLGAIPQLSSVAKAASGAPFDYIVERPHSAFSEAFRTLRTALMFATYGKPSKVVAVTSSIPGEGKTTTSIGLGRTAALQGLSVIIVDCDLRRRSLSSLIGLNNAQGLVELLAGETTLDAAIQVDERSSAHFLGCSPKAAPLKEVFAETAFDAFLDNLRSRYDLVVLDTAPVLPLTDARVLASKADSVLFLAKWRRTPRQLIVASLRALADAKAPVAGVALTQVNMKVRARYGLSDAGYGYTGYFVN